MNKPSDSSQGRPAQLGAAHLDAIVLANSYHGNSNLMVEMSTFALPEDRRPNYIAAIEPPDTYRGPFRAFVVANFASQPDADDVDNVH